MPEPIFPRTRSGDEMILSGMIAFRNDAFLFLLLEKYNPACQSC